MSAAADRMWKIRDAVLTYLYDAIAEGRTVRRMDPAEVSAAVGWTDGEITDGDINQALVYLAAEGQVNGILRSNGSVLRPQITSTGQNFVARGLSVRGPVEGPQSVPSSIVIHANGNTNVSVGSQNVTQSIESGDVAIDKAKAVATALEKAAAAEGVNPEAAAEARTLAADINAAAEKPEPDKMTLRGLLGKAMASLVTAAGTTAGNEVFNLALEAAPLFA